MTTPTSRIMAEYIAANLETTTLTLGTNLFDCPPIDMDDVGGVVVFVYAVLGDLPSSIKADASGTQRVITNERFVVAVRSAMLAGGAAMQIAQDIHDILNKASPAGYIDVMSTYSSPSYAAADDNKRFLITEEYQTQRHYDATVTGSGGLNPNAAGGDLGASFPDPTVNRFHSEDGDGDQFIFGTIADGQILHTEAGEVVGSDISLFALGLLDSADEADFLSALGVSAFGQDFIDSADAAAGRTVLGLGSAALLTATATGTALVTATDAAAARSTLGLGTAAVRNVPASGNASTSEVVLGTDTRLTDSRTPTGSAGGDVGGTFPASLTVTAVHSGATQLSIGAITDGELLVRSGSQITSTGAVVPSTRTVTGTAPITVNGASGTPQTLASDLTLAHATSGVVAAQSPSAINAFKRPMTTVNSFGHVTSLAYVETFLDLQYTRIGVFTDGNVFSNSNFSTLGQEAGTSGGIFPIIRVGVNSISTQGVHRWCATGGSDMPILLSGVYGIITRQVVRITNIPASGTTINCFGLMNVLSGGSLPNDGIYWAYNSAVSPFWLCVTASGGVRTITITNKLVTEGEWVDLRTKTSRDRSTAEFYWGDELITSHATNVPATTMGLTITISSYRTLAIAGINLIGVSSVWGARWDFVT